MFGLFKTKPKEAQPTLFVYLTQTALYRQLMNRLIKQVSASERVLLLYYFDQTGDGLKKLLEGAQLPFGSLADESSIMLASAREVNNLTLTNFTSVFVAEIHPMFGQDIGLNQFLLQRNPQAETTFYLSMDSPILRQFGAERITGLMHKLGMEENEMIEHKMITRSVLKAQQRIAGHVVHEMVAYSIEEWMDKNVKGMGEN